MDRWVLTVQMQNPLFQSPKHSGNGFLNIDDLPNGWGDPPIHLDAALFNLCYPFSAPHVSSFLSHSFSCTHSLGLLLPFDNKAHLPTYNYLASTHSVPTPMAISMLNSLYLFHLLCHALVYEPEGFNDAIHHGLAYKPVSRKVMAVPVPLLKGFQIICYLPNDPLADFVPGTNFTTGHEEALDLDPAKLL
ncbi:hypothetical protein PAXRUDRAFT_151907 [Paxillus rubicundulus Ve08.2h10]|uniref:Uncharacterized protein n=1 Tax=Paxillus rubicundulus Ve08.2h10 TaxID=930991 RepID=A0A0D0D1W0_9AGAM|nr:hypothetical protein PAXRUDRAFT_151907 [Paxillus rubicundulus Ve08.2h10]